MEGSIGGRGTHRLPESMPLMFVYMTNGLESRRPRASMEYEMDDARSVRSLLHAFLSLEARMHPPGSPTSPSA